MRRRGAIEVRSLANGGTREKFRDQNRAEMHMYFPLRVLLLIETSESAKYRDLQYEYRFVSARKEIQFLE